MFQCTRQNSLIQTAQNCVTAPNCVKFSLKRICLSESAEKTEADEKGRLRRRIYYLYERKESQQEE